MYNKVKKPSHSRTSSPNLKTQKQISSSNNITALYPLSQKPPTITRNRSHQQAPSPAKPSPPSLSSKSTQKFSKQQPLTPPQRKYLSHYENIAQLVEQQNCNLKEQNQYLINKLRDMQHKEQKVKRLYTKAKYYKTNYISLMKEIDIIKQETNIYRNWVEDLKQISIVEIPVLERRVRGEMMGNRGREDRRRSKGDKGRETIREEEESRWGE